MQSETRTWRQKYADPFPGKPAWVKYLAGLVAGLLTVALIMGLIVAVGKVADASTTPADVTVSASSGGDNERRPACGREDPCVVKSPGIKKRLNHALRYGKMKHDRADVIAWPRSLKKKILTKAHRYWVRHHGKVGKDLDRCITCVEWNRQREWRQFNRSADCVSSGYPTNMVQACTPNDGATSRVVCYNDVDPNPASTIGKCTFPSTPASQFTWNVRAVFCGGVIAAEFVTAGQATWFIAGKATGECLLPWLL